MQGQCFKLLFIMVLSISTILQADDQYLWLNSPVSGTLLERYPTPDGYSRTSVTEGSFAAFLRHLPMKPKASVLRYYSGKRVLFAPYAAGIIDLDIGKRDLQQCADTLIRLYSEYQLSKGRHQQLAFDFTSGDSYSYQDYLQGKRPLIQGRKVAWKNTQAQNHSRISFGKWLDIIFMYAGTASLHRDLEKVQHTDLEVGDLFISPGFPGHTVMVADIVVNTRGHKKLLLIEGFTPAMNAHVVQHVPSIIGGVWFDFESDGTLKTPVWDFSSSEIRRF